MANQEVEIVVHVDESLDAAGREELVQEMQGYDGVGHVHFTPQRPHLMVVDYDPSELRAMDVLAYVQNESLHAELIGGL